MTGRILPCGKTKGIRPSLSGKSICFSLVGKSAVKVLNVGSKMATSRCPQSQISDQGELATSSAAGEEGHH